MEDEFNPTDPEESFHQFKMECAQAIVDFHLELQDAAQDVELKPGVATTLKVDARKYATFVYYTQVAEGLDEDQYDELNEEIEERFDLHAALKAMGYFSPDELGEN